MKGIKDLSPGAYTPLLATTARESEATTIRHSLPIEIESQIKLTRANLGIMYILIWGFLGEDEQDKFIGQEAGSRSATLSQGATRFRHLATYGSQTGMHAPLVGQQTEQAHREEAGSSSATLTKGATCLQYLAT